MKATIVTLTSARVVNAPAGFAAAAPFLEVLSASPAPGILDSFDAAVVVLTVDIVLGRALLTPLRSKAELAGRPVAGGYVPSVAGADTLVTV